MIRHMCSISALLLFALACDGQVPSPTVLDRTSISVVAIACGDHSGTGFLWRSNQQVVTALHVVAGCDNDVYVRFEKVPTTRTASVVRVLRDADLAMLHIGDPPAVAALESSTVVPTTNDDFVALGYGLGAPSMGSTNLKVAFGSSRLRDILPDRSAQQVAQAGMPSLTLRIVRLQGHLLPGLSGAPILDTAGKVIAIGDGGLESGAAAVSWAVPISNAARLLSSTETFASESVHVGQLFAADLDATHGASITCGEMTLTKLRTATYEELSETTDDPGSVDFLRQVATMVDLQEISFDIYSDLRSGATLAAPSGVEFDETEDGCIADLKNRGLRMQVYGASIKNFSNAVRGFRKLTLEQSGLSWSPVVQPYSVDRDDGTTIRRALWAGAQPNAFSALGLGTPSAHALDVELGRKNAFLGIAIIGSDPRLNDTALGVFCGLNKEAAACSDFIDMVQQWTGLMLGGFLSTFPIN